MAATEWLKPMNATPFPNGELSPSDRQHAFLLWRDLHALDPDALERLAEAPATVQRAIKAASKASLRDELEPDASDPNPFR